MISGKRIALTVVAAIAVMLLPITQAGAQQKPNILFIMGDDIGWMRLVSYQQGLGIGETPNLDRIANEGAKFMTYYAEQSCTAGRNAFFTGMNPLRTGMIPPQLPGSPSYLRPGTPALAKFRYDLGYTTGEFGKNHLGDHTDALPTAHGFQEFWGNLSIIVFTTDNGPQTQTFPDGGITPFKANKLTTWEGGMRVPLVIRWPGVIKPGTMKTEIFASLDWLPTFVEIAGGPKGNDLNKQIMEGKYPGIVKTKLDGVNQIDYLTGKSEKSARDVFFYYTGATPSVVRYKNWKVYFSAQVKENTR